MRHFRLILTPTTFAIIALTHYACGSKSNSTDTSSGTAPISAIDGNTPDTSAAPPASPTAVQIATNAQSTAQVTSSAMDSATSAAAAGAGGTGAALLLFSENQNGQNFDIPAQPTQTVAVTAGSQKQDCYLGSSITARSSTTTPAWPESTDTTSVFADSKSDASTSTNMYVEPALIQYPATASTPTFTLSVPFTIASMVEVVQTDNRTITNTLADKAKTSMVQAGSYEEHRFWAAKNPITDAASANMKCSPIGGTGSSGTADGTAARIKWTDSGTTGQINGLNLLARHSSNSVVTKTYFPKVKGVLSTTASTLTWNRIANGERLVQWSTSTATASAVTGASVVIEKKITHSFARTDTQKSATGTTITELSGLDEVRATTPLVIQEYRDSTNSVLAHVIASGTIYKTGADATSNAVKWFTTFAYDNVKFDYQNSTEACIPVSGTVTLTVYDKEGGTQQGAITITYSSTTSTTSGKVDPSLAVSGDDADSTRAQWMMLHVNRRCELKNL